MNERYLLIFLFVMSVLTVIIAVFGGFKSTKGHTLKQKAINKTLGSTGQNFFYGLIGLVFSLFLGYMIFRKYLPSFSSEVQKVQYEVDSNLLIDLTFRTNSNGETYNMSHESASNLQPYGYVQMHFDASSLIKIDYSKCQLTEAPLELKNCKDVEVVNFRGNRLTNIPESLMKSLPKLKELNLESNPIDSLEVTRMREKYEEVMIIY
ncbi:MAG: hypothetical protein ACI85O_002223 [Saprospiraceae bacterium]|jgi:hypothetical protein